MMTLLIKATSVEANVNHIKEMDQTTAILTGNFLLALGVPRLWS